MKKLIFAVTVVSLITASTYSNVKAAEPSDNETEVICFYDKDEEGNLIYVCEEAPVVEPCDLCPPECWDV